MMEKEILDHVEKSIDELMQAFPWLNSEGSRKRLKSLLKAQNSALAEAITDRLFEDVFEERETFDPPSLVWVNEKVPLEVFGPEWIATFGAWELKLVSKPGAER